MSQNNTSTGSWPSQPVMGISRLLQMLADLTDCDSEQDLVDLLVRTTVVACAAQDCLAVLLGPDQVPTAAARIERVSVWSPDGPGAVTRPDLQSFVMQEGVLQVLKGGPEPVWTPSARTDAPASLQVTMTSAGQVLGALWMQRPATGEVFTEEERDRADVIVSHTSKSLTQMRHRRGTAHVLSELALPLDTPQPRARTGAEGKIVSLKAGGLCKDDRGVSHLVRRLTAKARTIVGTQMMFLSKIEAGTQRFLVIDAEPDLPVPAEGQELDVEASYCGMLLAGQLPSVVPDLQAQERPVNLPEGSPWGSGAYCGAPVVLPDGTTFGTLAGIDRRVGTTVNSARLEALRTMAKLIGLQLGKEQLQEQQRLAHRDAFGVFLGPDVRSTVLQPIINLATGDVAGFEALSRFTPSITGARRRPDQVFERAARLGMTLEIEQAAARSALALLAQTPEGSYLSINLSPRTLIHPSTRDLLGAHDLARIIIELTEHEEIDDYTLPIAVMESLRRDGARLAIDDLGAGFAGLQHLARLRPEVVKLDISFVRDVDTDPTRAAVARAVSGFAAEMGASLVAEGVETGAELARLRQLGASHGQGYLLGRPTAVENIETLCRRRTFPAA